MRTDAWMEREYLRVSFSKFKCQGLKVGECLVVLRSSEEATEFRLEWICSTGDKEKGW